MSNLDCSDQINIDVLIKQAFEKYESGNLSEAEIIFQHIVSIEPNNYEAIFFLGLIFRQQGKLESALDLIKRVTRLKNDEPDFFKELGQTFLELNLKAEATKSFETALSLDKNCITTLSALFAIYNESGNFKKSLEHIETTLQLAPDCWPALNARSHVLLNCGHTEEAITDLKESLRLNPDSSATFSSYLFALNYSTRISALDIYAEHKRYDVRYRKENAISTTINTKNLNPYKKLRIGYVSPDFFDHAVSMFTAPIITHHNNSEFEIFCYYIDKINDAVTLKLKGQSDHWRDCDDWLNDDIVKKIQEDDIDILVDLAGHTTNNRLDIFAARAAPIQITWLGYINTTGLSNMDYRIVDSYSDPVGISEHLHTEELLRLPNTQWCFEKPNQLIEVSILPSISNGYITFGSFNRYGKLSTKVLHLWTKLLREISNSKLIIHDTPEIQLQNISNFFSSHDIDLSRIAFKPRVSPQEFRKSHNYVDIALDSYPYSGATTTLESLWMGVPTLTLAGETSVSRSTSSIMRSLALSDWIATTEDEFIATAKYFSSDLNKLADLRLKLRQRVESSSLMDTIRFTKDIENIYREVWIRKCSIG